MKYMVRKYLLVAIALINCQNLIHAAERSNGQADSLRHQPESGYVREIVIGGLSGVIFGIVGAGLGAKAQDCDDDDSGEFCGLGGAAVGGIVGLSLGSAAGVYAAGAQTGKQGSFLGALAGSILGSVSGLMALSGTGVDGWPFLLITPPVFAAIGYNLTRPHSPSHSY